MHPDGQTPSVKIRALARFGLFAGSVGSLGNVVASVIGTGPVIGFATMACALLGAFILYEAAEVGRP